MEELLEGILWMWTRHKEGDMVTKIKEVRIDHNYTLLGSYIRFHTTLNF